jgi:hypothetical protein
MRIVKQLGLVLLATAAFSALASASALGSPVFLAHGAGPLLASADNTNTFHAPGAGINVECTALKLAQGVPPALQFLSILVTIQYESCKAAGVAATVSPVQYIIDANGEVTLENQVTIKGLGCSVTIPPAKNHNLRTVKFDNQANGTILLLSSVSGITSFGEGTLCTYGEESAGTYTGNARVALDGGSLKWDLNA